MLNRLILVLSFGGVGICDSMSTEHDGLNEADKELRVIRTRRKDPCLRNSDCLKNFLCYEFDDDVPLS